MPNVMEDYQKWKDENKYQVMEALSPEEYADLKEDIKTHGIQVPIEIDQDGNVIDGHNRARIAEELKKEGVYLEIPIIRRTYTSEAERRERAYSLNLKRRHLDREGKRRIVEKMLKEFPEKSNVSIAKAAGCDDKTVGTIRKKLESTSEIPKLEKRVGADGKERTTERAVKEPTPVPAAVAEVIEDLKAEIADDGLYLKVGMMCFNTIRTTVTPEGCKARMKKVCPPEYIDYAIEAINAAKLPVTNEGWEKAKVIIADIIAEKYLDPRKQYDFVEIEEKAGEVPKIIVEERQQPTTKREQIEQKLKEINAKEEEKILEVIESEIEKLAGAIRTPVFAAFLNKAVKAKLKEFGDTLDNVNDKDRQDFVNAWNVIKNFIREEK